MTENIQTIQKSRKPTVLVILDGWGFRESEEHNALAKANTPFFDYLWKNYPHTTLNASEEDVGLPEGQVGNSEVGHMTIGAGRIIDTDLVRITKAIRDGSFGTNPEFKKLFEHVQQNKSTLHILTLLSPGGVHSHQEHLHEFLKIAKTAGLSKVAIHAFTDGRDTPPKAGVSYLQMLEMEMAKTGIGHIATLAGRYFAMDRDNNWDRIEQVENAIFHCKGNICEVGTAVNIAKSLYEQGHTDEYLEPHVFTSETGEGTTIEPGDGVIFLNFRADRARQLCKRILERTAGQNVHFTTLTQYDKELKTNIAFPPIYPDKTLAHVIAEAGLTQLHIAETEKYAHVTYFFNGGQETSLPHEERVLIESRKDVKTHDLAPEMRAKEITDTVIKSLTSKTPPDFTVINYANADIVGHTANVEAIIKAVECLDQELKRLLEAVAQVSGVAIITADHGNAETNFDFDNQSPHTAHTKNLVPFIIFNKKVQITRPAGSLADIAPTVLQLMELPIPESMTGKKLV